MPKIFGDYRVNQYTASPGQTVFIYTYKVYSDDEVKVQKNDALLILGDDYSVQNAGEPSGGTITLSVGAEGYDIITITGNTEISRDTEFTNGGAFDADAINDEYNKLDDLISETTLFGESNIRLRQHTTGFDTTFMPSSRRALMVNEGGDGMVMSAYDPDLAGNAEEYAQEAKDARDAAIVAENNAEAYANSINNNALASNIIPSETELWNLGSSLKLWNNIYSKDLFVTGYVGITGNLVTSEGASLDGGIVVRTDKFIVDKDTGDTTIGGNLTVNGSMPGASSYALIKNKLPSGTSGGDALKFQVQKRPLNTVSFNNIDGLSLNNSTISLLKGTYIITVSLQHYSSPTINTMAKLGIVNTTKSTTTILGQAILPAGTTNSSYGTSIIVIDDSEPYQDIEVTQYTTEETLLYGFGFPMSLSGVDEVYATVLIQKI